MPGSINPISLPLLNKILPSHKSPCINDGVGFLGFKALLDRDYNIIMGTLVLFTMVRLFGNLISDLAYALIDPRIRFK